MIEPVNTTDDTTLTWMSTVPSVATVDQEGNVTAVSEGYAIIRVKTVNGISTTCRVEVVETQEVPITGVSLDQESMTLTEGESGTLNATIIPGDTTDDRTLTWSSDAPEVAVVNDGEITAIAPGTATITVTTSNGKSDSCIVTVERKEIEIIRKHMWPLTIIPPRCKEAWIVNGTDTWISLIESAARFRCLSALRRNWIDRPLRLSLRYAEDAGRQASTFTAKEE